MLQVNLILLLFTNLFLISWAQDGFYWKNYEGETPQDAFVVNTPQDQLIYVGLTLHPLHFILPGTIKPKEKAIFYEYGGIEHTTKLDVMILCTTQSDRFKWIEVSAGASIADVTRNSNMERYELIPAGSDTERPLYVGRFITDENELVIGKVLANSNSLEQIFGGKGLVRGVYEVLLYDPNNKKKSTCKAPITINIYNDYE